MKKKTLGILLVVAAMALVCFAGAAAADTISLDVTVRDADSGDALEGALVSLYDETTETELSAGTTNASGIYRKNALESADTYRMDITKDGYLSYTKTIVIPNTITVTYPVTAELTPVAQVEPVTPVTSVIPTESRGKW